MGRCLRIKLWAQCAAAEQWGTCRAAASCDMPAGWTQLLWFQSRLTCLWPRRRPSSTVTLLVLWYELLRGLSRPVFRFYSYVTAQLTAFQSCSLNAAGTSCSLFCVIETETRSLCFNFLFWWRNLFLSLINHTNTQQQFKCMHKKNLVTFTTLWLIAQLWQILCYLLFIIRNKNRFQVFLCKLRSLMCQSWDFSFPAFFSCVHTDSQFLEFQKCAFYFFRFLTFFSDFWLCLKNLMLLIDLDSQNCIVSVIIPNQSRILIINCEYFVVIEVLPNSIYH